MPNCKVFYTVYIYQLMLVNALPNLSATIIILIIGIKQFFSQTVQFISLVVVVHGLWSTKESFCALIKIKNVTGMCFSAASNAARPV